MTIPWGFFIGLVLGWAMAEVSTHLNHRRRIQRVMTEVCKESNELMGRLLDLKERREVKPPAPTGMREDP